MKADPEKDEWDVKKQVHSSIKLIPKKVEVLKETQDIIPEVETKLSGARSDLNLLVSDLVVRVFKISSNHHTGKRQPG
jgi:hypothetical protein